MNLGIVPPQATDLEQAVLGAMILEKSCLSEVIPEIRPEIFYKDAHQLISKAIVNLFRSGEQVDILTVTNQLRKEGNLEKAGGAFYITELTSKIASSAHVMTHVKIIQEMFFKRTMISLGSLLQKDGYDDTVDAFDLLDKAQASLIGLVAGMVSQKAVSVKTSAVQVFEEMARNMAKNQSNEITGIPTPIDELNSFTGGWQKGDLVIIAGRPAMGKTAFALACARSAAKANEPVLIFSLEMTHKKLTYRLISQETKVRTVTEMQRGSLSQDQLNEMMIKTKQLTNYKISIDDQASLSIMALRAKANQLKMETGLGMIMVDYLQLMSDEAKGSNREQEISRISRALKVLAKDLDVPVIALSQLSRAVETRGGDHKPKLSDLRESGAIEQDADMVIFLYRPEYYGIPEMDYEDLGTISTKGLAIGDIAKHRNGSVGEFRMDFDARHVNFTNYQNSSIDDRDRILSLPSGEKNFM